MRTLFHRTELIVGLVTLVMVAVLASACGLSDNKPPKIATLEAESRYIYPLGTSEIQCIALDPEGDNMNFKWSCTEGSFTGNGPIVTWKAPNSYGDCHIMVLVEDENGGTANSTLTIGVMAKQDQKRNCCDN